MMVSIVHALRMHVGPHLLASPLSRHFPYSIPNDMEAPDPPSPLRQAVSPARRAAIHSEFALVEGLPPIRQIFAPFRNFQTPHHQPPTTTPDGHDQHQHQHWRREIPFVAGCTCTSSDSDPQNMLLSSQMPPSDAKDPWAENREATAQHDGR